MKVMVLGGDGMLGHQLVRSLCDAGHEVVATTRRPPSGQTTDAFDRSLVISGVEARLHDTVLNAIADTEPEALVNCIGIVKQRPEAKDAVGSIHVNSLFPHELASMCRVAGTRMIHISTDCVFSGKTGSYSEHDIPDPVDLYGRSKLLGEVADGAVTLRTSIIGLELGRHHSLVEWFLRQKGEAAGWSKALYSGVTTLELSRVIHRILTDHRDLQGIWHVSSDPIDKYTLLSKLRRMLNMPLTVVPDNRLTIDRTLDSKLFRTAVGWEPPAWDAMLAELADSIEKRRIARHA